MIKFPKKILGELTKHLEEEKRKLIKQIADLSQQDPFADTDRLIDNASSDTDAKEEVNHERYQAMVNELKTKLEAVEWALDRIAKGSYGTCMNCGNLIDTDRLALVPTARFCMKCHQDKGE